MVPRIRSTRCGVAPSDDNCDGGPPGLASLADGASDGGASQQQLRGSLLRRLGLCCGAPETDLKDDLPLLFEYTPDDALPDSPAEQGGVSYVYGSSLPLVGNPLRTGDLLLWNDDAFVRITVSLYINGYSVASGDDALPFDVALSPFCQVRAGSLRNEGPQDLDTSGLRAFRVTIFSHNTAATFATTGEDADADRARWVADFARSIRTLTTSLFPPFIPRTEPLAHVPWTATRILAGYLVTWVQHGADLVYCELHSHTKSGALFAGYEDESCRTRVLAVRITVDTTLVEMSGVDCSCFALNGEHFAARSAAEKFLWVRSLRNLKVKLSNTSLGHDVVGGVELENYRAAILECVNEVPTFAHQPFGPLLPRKVRRRHPRAKAGGRQAAESVEECQVSVPDEVQEDCCKPSTCSAPGGMREESQEPPAPTPAAAGGHEVEWNQAQTPSRWRGNWRPSSSLEASRLTHGAPVRQSHSCPPARCRPDEGEDGLLPFGGEVLIRCKSDAPVDSEYEAVTKVVQDFRKPELPAQVAAGCDKPEGDHDGPAARSLREKSAAARAKACLSL